MNFYSQAGQDKWVLDSTKHKKSKKFFVDIGAYDGINTSNTLALEENGWSGICVEANPDVFASLVVNRPKATNLHMAASSFNGQLNFSGFSSTSDKSAPVVPCATLESILETTNCPHVIDYLSMDIEGMEPEVLEVFDFSKYKINTATIEHNLYMDGPAKKNKIFEIMSRNGFIRVIEDAPCLDPNPMYHMKPYEDWYVRSDFLPTKL
jgi:FkbM family methyltransferase